MNEKKTASIGIELVDIFFREKKKERKRRGKKAKLFRGILNFPFALYKCFESAL